VSIREPRKTRLAVLMPVALACLAVQSATAQLSAQDRRRALRLSAGDAARRFQNLEVEGSKMETKHEPGRQVTKWQQRKRVNFFQALVVCLSLLVFVGSPASAN